MNLNSVASSTDWITPLCAGIDCLLHRRVVFGVAAESMSLYLICNLLRARNVNITPHWHYIDQKRHIFNIDAGIANLAWRRLNKAGAEMLIEEPRNPR